MSSLFLYDFLDTIPGPEAKIIDLLIKIVTKINGIQETEIGSVIGIGG